MSDHLLLATKSAHSDKLLEPSGVEERKKLDFAAFTELSKTATVAMHDYVRREIERITTVAQDAADAYWFVQKEARSEPAQYEPCFVGTRVRLKDMTLSAEWYRNRFARDGQGGKRMYSQYIKKGQGHSYSMFAFRREPLWARQVIEMIEKRYAILRQRAEIVGKIKRALNEYEKLLETG